MDQMITFNTQSDPEKKPYQTKPKKLHVSIQKKKKVDHRQLLKTTPKKNILWLFCSA
jgi:hypothetical protein